MSIGSFSLANMGAPADRNTQIYFLGPKVRILLLYQTQGLFIICAPVTDVTKNPLSKITHKWVTKKKNSLVNLLSLNLVKIRRGHFFYFTV